MPDCSYNKERQQNSTGSPRPGLHPCAAAHWPTVDGGLAAAQNIPSTIRAAVACEIGARRMQFAGCHCQVRRREIHLSLGIPGPHRQRNGASKHCEEGSLGGRERGGRAPRPAAHGLWESARHSRACVSDRAVRERARVVSGPCCDLCDWQLRRSISQFIIGKSTL